jgi:hypothetical protein
VSEWKRRAREVHSRSVKSVRCLAQGLWIVGIERHRARSPLTLGTENKAAKWPRDPSLLSELGPPPFGHQIGNGANRKPAPPGARLTCPIVQAY